jgi:predicted MPP superfamily phosphohydrolase
MAVAASGALAAAADAALFEPYHAKLVEIEIPLTRLPPAWNGLRIAQLSDFHYDERFSAPVIREAVTVVNGLRPELVVLTGDFITVPLAADKPATKQAGLAIEPCVGLLSQLRAPLGVFAVLGNHDALSDPVRIRQTLEAGGIPVLFNRSISLERADRRLWLAGIDDALEGEANLSSALHGIPPSDPVILLAHEPDIALQVSSFPVDLQLSGHSHGGQIRFPLIGAPVLPALGQKFPWGLHRIGNLMLYTNVGIGTIRLPVRFNCRPEITLIRLRSVA